MAITTPDACWLWTGAQNARNRGHIRIGTAGEGYAKAPRVAFFLCHGYWPRQANHLPVDCHNMHCCNPLHIYDGDQKDNIADTAADGTKPSRWKLAPDVRREIANRYEAGGISQRELGDVYGVSQNAISRIVRSLRNTHGGN